MPPVLFMKNNINYLYKIVNYICILNSPIATNVFFFFEISDINKNLFPNMYFCSTLMGPLQPNFYYTEDQLKSIQPKR